jgi:hypothetical protein
MRKKSERAKRQNAREKILFDPEFRDSFFFVKSLFG